MLQKLNDMTKKLDYFDIGLTKISVIFGTIAAVKLFPQLLNISYAILIVLVVITAIRPIYRFYLGK